MTEETLIVASEDRADKYIATVTDLTRNRIQNLIKSGNVLVNGRTAKPSGTIHPGDTVTLSIPDPTPIDTIPEDIPISVIYEDDSLCVIDKPQGMVVHPAPGHESGTLVNALLFHFKGLSSIGGEYRPGIVHRIDRMTSGLLVVAKNDTAHIALSDQFKTHAAHRTYLALVDGNIKEDNGTVDAPIGRHPTDRKKMAIVPNGRPAVTHWTVLRRFGTRTLCNVSLETGRTHQIRVHMASIHHPVTGDTVYGASKPALCLEGQALHGYRLEFQHPETGEDMHFLSPIPSYFEHALQIISPGISADEIMREIVSRCK